MTLDIDRAKQPSRSLVINSIAMQETFATVREETLGKPVLEFVFAANEVEIAVELDLGHVTPLTTQHVEITSPWVPVCKVPTSIVLAGHY